MHKSQASLSLTSSNLLFLLTTSKDMINTITKAVRTQTFAWILARKINMDRSSDNDQSNRHFSLSRESSLNTSFFQYNSL